MDQKEYETKKKRLQEIEQLIIQAQNSMKSANEKKKDEDNPKKPEEKAESKKPLVDNSTLTTFFLIFGLLFIFTTPIAAFATALAGSLLYDGLKKGYIVNMYSDSSGGKGSGPKGDKPQNKAPEQKKVEKKENNQKSLEDKIGLLMKERETLLKSLKEANAQIPPLENKINLNNAPTKAAPLNQDNQLGRSSR